MNKFIEKIFKDESGKIVIFQAPNTPIIGWFIFTLLGLITISPGVDRVIDLLSFGFIFVWCYLEITEGVNYFRKILGIIVIVFILLL